MTTIHTRVAGVTFEKRQAVIERCAVDQHIVLRPEPNNPYDANAIAVFAVSGDFLFGQVEEQIGYLPAALARELSPTFMSSVAGTIVKISDGWLKEDGSFAPRGVTIVFALDFPE
jgi:hypothetical protein